MNNKSCHFCRVSDDLIEVRQACGRQKTTVSSCRTCAESLGIQEFVENISWNLGYMCSRIFQADIDSDRRYRICEHCGQSIDNIWKTSRVGCSICYDVFKGDIDLLIKQRLVSNSHTGRLPDRINSVKQIFFEKAHLERSLQFSVDNENYENAHYLKKVLDSYEGRFKKND